MAFIRDYAAISGDPFSFRRPKWARRFKPGKMLGRIAGPLASLVPGVGSAMEFARGYGLMAGDPAPSKRKSAASGPAHKAKKKAQHRAAKASGHAQTKGADKRRGRGISGRDVAEILAQNAGGAITAIGSAAGSLLHGGNPISTMGGIVTGEFDPKHPGGGHFGRHHRRTNPANVKALRRSIRRLEGFEKLVKSVEKAFPRLKRAHAHHTSHRRGHKPGCKCVACR